MIMSAIRFIPQCLGRRQLTILAGFLLFLSLIVGYLHFESYPIQGLALNPFKTPVVLNPDDTQDLPLDTTKPLDFTSTASANASWASGAAAYLQAIMNPPSNTLLSQLDCPSLNTPRYTDLKLPSTNSNSTNHERSYLFAIDLQTVEPLLPRLLGSVVEVIRFLGPEHCLLSIVHGPSKDHTSDILNSLGPLLKDAGIAHNFISSDIDLEMGQEDRVENLAEIRNIALEPLTEPTSKYKFISDATVVFLDHVVICPNDILELVHQKTLLGAVMTCAMDWTYTGSEPTFHDVWIARTMSGDSFFDIPSDGSWDEAPNLFWNDDKSGDRFRAHQPFQVFSCWSGAVAFTSRAVVGQSAIKFRGKTEEECNQGESQLFCKDMWLHDLRRIAVVPTINLEYGGSNKMNNQIKTDKGYTFEWTELEDVKGTEFDWEVEPPEKVRCVPGDYEDQEWRPWDEGVENGP